MVELLRRVYDIARMLPEDEQIRLAEGMWRDLAKLEGHGASSGHDDEPEVPTEDDVVTSLQ